MTALSDIARALAGIASDGMSMPVHPARQPDQTAGTGYVRLVRAAAGATARAATSTWEVTVLAAADDMPAGELAALDACGLAAASLMGCLRPGTATWDGTAIGLRPGTATIAPQAAPPVWEATYTLDVACDWPA